MPVEFAPPAEQPPPDVNIEVLPIEAPSGVNYYLVLFKDVPALLIRLIYNLQGYIADFRQQKIWSLPGDLVINDVEVAIAVLQSHVVNSGASAYN